MNNKNNDIYKVDSIEELNFDANDLFKTDTQELLKVDSIKDGDIYNNKENKNIGISTIENTIIM